VWTLRLRPRSPACFVDLSAKCHRVLGIAGGALPAHSPHTSAAISRTAAASAPPSALLIPQQQFHSVSSARRSPRRFRRLQRGVLPSAIVDMLYTPVSEVLAAGQSPSTTPRTDTRRNRCSCSRSQWLSCRAVFIPTMVPLLAVVAPTLIPSLFHRPYVEGLPSSPRAHLHPCPALPLDWRDAGARHRTGSCSWSCVLKWPSPSPWSGRACASLTDRRAVCGWICAEEICRLIPAHHAALLFGTTSAALPPRSADRRCRSIAAAFPCALALRLAAGAAPVQLATAGNRPSASPIWKRPRDGDPAPVRALIPQQSRTCSWFREACLDADRLAQQRSQSGRTPQRDERPLFARHE